MVTIHFFFITIFQIRFIKSEILSTEIPDFDKLELNFDQLDGQEVLESIANGEVDDEFYDFDLQNTINISDTMD